MQATRLVGVTMLREFKEFAMRGNVLDMAVGIIIGAAFGRIVTSLVNDVIMPPFGLSLLGKVDFSSLFVNLSGTAYSSLAEAKKAGAPVICVGAFLNTVLDFVDGGVRDLPADQAGQPVQEGTRAGRRQHEGLPVLPGPGHLVKAVRCAHCTSQLPAA